MKKKEFILQAAIAIYPHENSHSFCNKSSAFKQAEELAEEAEKRGYFKTSSSKAEYETYHPDFERFWNLYPKKAGKAAAQKAWQKLKPKIIHVESALKWQIKSDAWTKQNGDFIPHPSTYLNQKRWLDVPYNPFEDMSQFKTIHDCAPHWKNKEFRLKLEKYDPELHKKIRHSFL